MRNPWFPKVLILNLTSKDFNIWGLQIYQLITWRNSKNNILTGTIQTLHNNKFPFVFYLLEKHSGRSKLKIHSTPFSGKTIPITTWCLLMMVLNQTSWEKSEVIKKKGKFQVIKFKLSIVPPQKGSFPLFSSWVRSTVKMLS